MNGARQNFPIFIINLLDMECYLGNDVSKGYADIVVLGPDLVPLEEPLQFDDTREGHTLLQGWIEGLFQQHGITLLNCAVESTGGLENNWHEMLVGLGAKLPLRVARLNPSTVKDAAKAELGKNTTDAVSARNIAMYIMRYEDRVDYRAKDTKYASFRSLTNHLSMVKRQKTQLINELKQLLYTCFPELLTFFRRGIPVWALNLIIKFPSIAALSKARPSTVAKIKGVTLEKATKLVEAAKRSVSSRSTDTDAFLIASIAEDIIQKVKRIKDLNAHLAKECKGPEVELLQSIVGIAAYSAAAIMTEIEDISQFPSPKKLASNFGFNPNTRQSGDKASPSRMSKKGRPALRAALFMCARCASVRDPHMKAIYDRQIANGKKDKQAIATVMHKMIRVVWGVLKNGTPYDPQIDKANQLRKPQTQEDQTVKETMAKRRIQSYDTTAPISRTAHKKRKALLASQSGNAENMRDLAKVPTT